MGYFDEPVTFCSFKNSVIACYFFCDQIVPVHYTIHRGLPVFSFCVNFIRPALQVLGPQALARVLPGVLIGQLALSSVFVSREIGGLPTRTGLRGKQKTLPQQGSLGTLGSRKNVSLTLQDSAPSMGFI